MTKEEIISLCDSIKTSFSVIFLTVYVAAALVAISAFISGNCDWFVYFMLGSILGDILTFLFIGGLLKDD